MKSFKKIRNIIQHEFPDFFISSIKKTGEGDNSKAFLINKNYIFRFAKTEAARRDLKLETAVLPEICGSIKLTIPQFLFIDKEFGFVGYKSIRGKFLTPKRYRTLNTKTQTKIQKTLARFLTELHEIDIRALEEFGVPIMDYKQEHSDDFINAQTLIYPNLSQRQREKITHSFNLYLNDQNNFNYKPTLIHNDLSTNHILFRKKINDISGIIDFGDLAIGDPDYDLMYLMDSFGETFISGLLRFYQHNHPENLFKKLHFFALANKIQILVESIKQDDETEIKDGYKSLKKWLKKTSFI